MESAESIRTMERDIRSIYELLRTNQSAVGDDAMVLPTGNPSQEAQEAPSPPVSEIEEAVFTAKPANKAAALSAEAPAYAMQGQSIWQRDMVKYPLIFVFSFAFFYLFLNFGAVYTKISSKFKTDQPKPQTAGRVLGVSTPEYDAWIGKYFYRANNADALAPNNDFDGDGLTNYQEFLLKTNPIKKDTDDDTYGDGQEILNGYSPLTEGALSDSERQIIRDWDLQEINNRISYYATGMLQNKMAQSSSLPDISYNLDQPGELVIPKLSVKAPIIWTKKVEDFSRDLNNGLVHYPGTSLPGQAGVSYISGHSSTFIWNTSPYGQVLTRLNELNPGDEFFITVYQASGQKTDLRYVVTGKQEYQPDDQAQFVAYNETDSIVNLSTCWPIGSTARRYVVSGRLAGI